MWYVWFSILNDVYNILNGRRWSLSAPSTWGTCPDPVHIQTITISMEEIMRSWGRGQWGKGAGDRLSSASGMGRTGGRIVIVAEGVEVLWDGGLHKCWMCHSSQPTPFSSITGFQESKPLHCPPSTSAQPITPALFWKMSWKMLGKASELRRHE